eukprot:CAMPEP_0198125444 /NCGR_PEP_ID=MMETSP1442-20131203/42593_1 /TAXON_ID= /ORGANISM="Craspedostauros australis, Strain CCMP3328" /LENGTH=205 /DNA_ID=CAMNT_0043785041 /DNA_START=264 /DNA_END=881 /DNA_ORIENTATION=-
MPDHELSSYEKARIEKMRRNHERLHSLGLITSQQEVEWNHDIMGIGTPAAGFLSHQTAAAHESTRSKRKNPSDEDGAVNTTRVTRPKRKSRRLQGLTPDGLKADEAAARKETTVRKFVQKRRRQIAKNPSSAKTKNPTATYDHCLMRVQSMTHAGLKRRVNVIERAAGKDCVLKMTIFHRCLKDEGLDELATLAKEALDRLLDLS